MSVKVAVMQPYFFPYAGYFRLFAAADVFVVLDCVQFPRRGWVHRNQFVDSVGQVHWLTLPIEKGPRDSTTITSLEFLPCASQIMQDNFRRFPCLEHLASQLPQLHREIFDFDRDVLAYLVENMRRVNELLNLTRPLILASDLDIPEEITGQERIIEIVKKVGASDYINAPGGRELYDTKVFAKAGIGLDFLPDYQGSCLSILERLVKEDAEKIRHEIEVNLLTEPGEHALS